MLLEDSIDFWRGEAAEDQALAVVLPPAVEGPEPHTREVHSVGVLGLVVQVMEDVLGGGAGRLKHAVFLASAGSQ